jgi:hypothetical protein
LRPGSPRGAWSARDVVTSHDSTGARILLHLPSGTYLRLDESAARIVDLLNEDPDPDRAASELATRFGIPVEQALGDVYTVITAVHGQSASRIDRGRIPTATGVAAVARGWLRQPWAGRSATVQAALVVMVIEAGLAVSSLPTLAKFLGVPLATGQDAPPMDVDLDEALAVLNDRELRAMWAVGWVLERWLFDETCLRRSLAFGWFIRRRRPVLRLGMIDDGETIAHAWVEAQGRAFDSAAVTGTFASGASTPTFRPTDGPSAAGVEPPGQDGAGPEVAPMEDALSEDLSAEEAPLDDGIQ